jgi:RNA polymerase sigma factor (TIGR02999 family)
MIHGGSFAEGHYRVAESVERRRTGSFREADPARISRVAPARPPLYGRERDGHTLQSTALVHEAYERLIDLKDMSWQNRAHFFAVSARLMRRILVDYARTRRFHKRGGEWRQVPLNEALAVFREQGTDIVALDDALLTLGGIDPRKASVVEMRFFGGLTSKETAEVLNVSEETVLRDWRLAKVWLLRQLSKSDEH